jgi:uncharacterized protein
LPAVTIDGAKAIGKTVTASKPAATILMLDLPADQALLQANPEFILTAKRPVLIDEWQKAPFIWDVVRRAVDAGAKPGSFILTGSANSQPDVHSGAGRIVRLRMYPLSLAERRIEKATVSVRALLQQKHHRIEGHTKIAAADYAHEIVASGFPAIRTLSPKARTMQLDGYLARIIDTDFRDMGHVARRPASLRGWLAEYAAATASNAAYTSLLDGATPGHGEKPTKSTSIAYRDVLERLWLIEPLPGFLPSQNQLARLAQGPKHHVADPALAARLLGLSAEALLTNNVDKNLTRGLIFGALFESLVTLSMRSYAQSAHATLSHLRTGNGDHEVDLILQRDDSAVFGIEIKLSAMIEDADVKHLHWLKRKMKDQWLGGMIICSGPHAYTRPDGIFVVPAALLGP